MNNKTQAELNRRRSQAVVKLLEKWTDVYRRKNANYGDSWQLTGQIMDKLYPNGIKLDTPRKHIMYGMMVRMLDKIIRAGNLELNAVADQVGEKSAESFGDLGVYAFMASAAALDEQTINTTVFTKEEGLPPIPHDIQMAQATGGDYTAEG